MEGEGRKKLKIEPWPSGSPITWRLLAAFMSNVQLYKENKVY